MALVENRSDLTHQTTTYSLYREYLLVQKIRIEKKNGSREYFQSNRCIDKLQNIAKYLQNMCTKFAQTKKIYAKLNLVNQCGITLSEYTRTKLGLKTL